MPNPAQQSSKWADNHWYPIDPVLNRDEFKQKAYGKPKKSGHLAYRPYVADFYMGYPGRVDQAIDEAREKRKQLGKNFDSPADKAIAPRLDDWTLNRQNPAHVYSDQPVLESGNLLAGRAYIDGIMDSKNRRFSTVTTFGPRNAAKDSLNVFQSKSPFDPMSEEMVHSAQPYSTGSNYDVENYFGGPSTRLPYAARNKELGAKLTNMKQDYIKRNWPFSEKRKDSFDREDAKKVLDKFYRGINADAGLQMLRFMKNKKGERPGLDYIKDNEEYLLDFLESTVQNDQKPEDAMSQYA